MTSTRNVAQAEQEVFQFVVRQRERVAARDDDVADFLVLAHVLDHPLVVATDRVPTAANHRGALAGAEAAVHGADMRRHHEATIRIAMGDARHGRILFFLEGVLEFEIGVRFEWGGHRLQADGIVGIIDIDEGEVIRRNGELVFRFELPHDFQLFFREGKEIAELADRPDGVLGLPAPVVPLLFGDVAPERVAPGLTGRFFIVVGAIHYR